MATNRNENANEQAARAADIGRENIRAATDAGQRLTDQVVQLFGFSGERGQELTRQSSHNIEVVTETSAVLARGFQDLSREWLGIMQERMQKNVDGLAALARCRTLQDYVALQSELARNSLEQTVEGTRRLAELSTRVAAEASQTLSTQNRGGRRAA
jgi:phasin family protein